MSFVIKYGDQYAECKDGAVDGWSYSQRRASRFDTYDEAARIADTYVREAHEEGTLEAGVTVTEADPIYVNAYSVSRHYGGPEEGGWWYDAGTPLASVPMKADATDEEIEKEKARLTELLGWPREPSQGRYSVNGGDDFEVWVEDHPAEHFPKERPHYE